MKYSWEGDKAPSLIPATRFTGRITRLLAHGRRYTGGDAAPLVLGGLFLVVLIAGGLLHHAAVPRLEWMNVNVALAVAPIALATVLFCVQRRGPIWWAGVGVFILLLPNTPYILTDVIHLQESVASARRAGGSGIGMGLTFVALFTLGILGYTYVVALIVADLRRHGRMRFIWPVLLIVNAACRVRGLVGAGPSPQLLGCGAPAPAGRRGDERHQRPGRGRHRRRLRRRRRGVPHHLPAHRARHEVNLGATCSANRRIERTIWLWATPPTPPQRMRLRMPASRRAATFSAHPFGSSKMKTLSAQSS